MKKIIGLIAVCVATEAFAQTGNQLTPQAKPVLEMVSIDKMPLPLPPGEADKVRKNFGGAKATDGFSTVDQAPEMVKGFFAHMNAAKTYIARKKLMGNQQKNGDTSIPEVHEDLSTLKVRFKPKSLDRATLIAAAPHGTKIDDAWTGVERFFQIPGAGSVRFSELDLAASDGKFFMIKEAVNTRVNGNPAISRVFTDTDGQTIEEVVWVEGGKLYMLTYGPDLNPGNKAKANGHISAFSLVQELH